MISFLFLFCAFYCLVGGIYYDLASPLVFDPQFYINTNYDLHKHRIDTISKARHHWLHSGIKQGRQGCGSFHSKQYLARYHDLSVSYGNNYTGAVIHFLTHQHEGRYGYKNGGFEGRWTISSHNNIFISASSYRGGAIDSIVWNHKEMINSYDHGRELQMAAYTNTYGECYNPTEAGGRDDCTSGNTTTQIKWIRASANILETEVYPSFWIQPSSQQRHTTNIKMCSAGDNAINNKTTYDHLFRKKVTIGVFNIQNCIEYISNFTIGGDWPRDIDWIQMEAPTGYMPLDFTEKYNFDIQKNILQYYYSNTNPVVLSTSDGLYAMGAYSPEGQGADMPIEYGAIGFTHHGSYANKSNKWNIVLKKRPFEDGDIHNIVYKSYICLGTLSMVSECLHKISIAVPRV